MAEIAENLHRREITALERSELLAKWVKLTEEKRQVQSAGNEHSKPAQLAPVSKGGRGKASGIRQAAREIGVPRDSIARAVKVAGLSDEAKEAAKEAGLADNQSALLAGNEIRKLNCKSRDREFSICGEPHAARLIHLDRAGIQAGGP
ncbi:hypothetical protein AKG11_03700 [Shinella sp. SUS2]|uniref:hypothetical protein n=1 Tax=unclassified Shinella TaxID=2643062 RepID=UPI0006813ABC|nr:MULTISPECIES: hypothetical protein [unclassified Shinella]KNY18247.1 hypothetical protein AKG11_03700 [Shinella sp. SUS2]KOC77442.1 hypothetical protein AKG10_01170 [Shinella sp. GWS1]